MTTAIGPVAGAPATAGHSNAYNLFILVLTILSLAVMVLMVLPLNDATLQVLTVYDNLICCIFLLDFAVNLRRSEPKRAYWIDRGGWLDLLGSIPSLGFFRFTVLFRLFRLSRLARISRLMGGAGKQELVRDIIQNRGQYAIFITLLLMIVVLTVSSVVILQVESRAPDSNITTGGDALWWAIVTITTVGYGDFYPVTALGRQVAVVVMFSGVAIIGALASILASLLVPSPAEREVDPAIAGMEHELASVRAELAEVLELLRSPDTRAHPGSTVQPPEPDPRPTT
jgi:voltage-gated potassium channel